MERKACFHESMNGVTRHQHTHTHMHTDAWMHTFAHTALAFHSPFRVMYSKAQNSTGHPKLLHSHTPGHTHFVQPPGRWTESGGHTQTFTHSFSCPDMARINTILTHSHTASHTDAQVQGAGSQASHCHINPPATASHCHTQTPAHVQTPSSITPPTHAQPNTQTLSHTVTQTHTFTQHSSDTSHTSPSVTHT